MTNLSPFKRLIQFFFVHYQNRWALLRKLLKFYAVFSCVHVLYKLYSLAALSVRVRRLWKHIPGFFDNIFATEFQKKADFLHDFYEEHANKYPKNDLIKLGTPDPGMIFNSPKAVKWLLKDEFVHVTKPAKSDFLFCMMNDFLGSNGIFVLPHGDMNPKENDMWKSQRKVSSRIFTKYNFQSVMYGTFVGKTDIFIKRLERVAKAGSKVDIQNLFFSFTMDSIEKFFMGKEVNSLSGDMSEYGKLFDQTHAAMMRILIENIRTTILITFMPWPIGPWSFESNFCDNLGMKLFFSFNKDCIRFKKGIQSLNSYINKYITETRNDPMLHKRKDIIANFLNSKMGATISDKTLRDIVLNLTIAGRDTTACTLSWLIFELTQNPDVQRKLCVEIDSVLGGNIPRLEDLEAEKMPYLNGVFYETLRLHPAVPTNQKENMKDLVFLDGTIIPKGVVLIYSPYAMGRNPTRYPNPTKFDPTRWIPFSQPNGYEFPVFQAGPRFCLGKEMATFEAKFLISRLLQKFTFSLLEGESKNIIYSLMLTASISNHPKRKTSNLWVIPKSRNFLEGK